MVLFVERLGIGMHKVSWTIFIIIFGMINGEVLINQINRDNDGSPITVTVNSTIQVMIVYKNLVTINPYRIKTVSNNSSEANPVLIVAQQVRQVTAWSLPMLVASSKWGQRFFYRNAAKTLCHDYMDTILLNSDIPTVIAQNFIIALSTSNPNDVSVTVELIEEQDFHVKSDHNYSFTVSPSESRYVFYKFNENTSDTVVVDVDSQDEVCLTISIQDCKCPVFDNNMDVKYEGLHQTINTKGAITLPKRNYVGGFFLVFVAKPDNYECSQQSSVLPRLTRISALTPLAMSEVSFRIRNGITATDYLLAVCVILLILLGSGIILIISAIMFHRRGTISANTYEDVIVTDYFEPMSEEHISKILNEDDLKLAELARNPKRIKQRSYNYLWHTLSIAIFYSIPVVQLVVTYQRIVNRTGDEDMCYYNFMCANPAFGFSDFNHIYSNIGYVIFGIIFICVVVDRHRLIKMRKDKGIPVHYGLFHAMGVALIIEGLLSACYHICPSQSNYQFDTSFMYVMAVLCMVKLYQNRHPDINATAYTTFTILGCAIFMAMIGILNGSLLIWIVFVVCYTLLCIYLSFKIYFLNYVVDGIMQFRDLINKNGFTKDAINPIRKGTFILLLLANIANCSMLVIGLMLYNSNVTDFGTFLLGLLMGNSVIYIIFYTAMKLIHREKVCPESIIYGLFSIASWASSSVFFLDAATLWTVTPAESRQWNQECILFNFFDKHDVWHLLSAPALYFTFMFLMTLDDDIIDKDQNEIPVF